jgi:D-beta-D-heptose 7-phosphate kinase/D-beta-D-heptose 1-phosphate adenosyltransferase
VATLHKLRILADGQYVVRFDEEASRRLPTRVESALAQRVERLYPTCDLVVVSDYCYGVVTDTILSRLRELRAERPCVLYADSKQLDRFPTLGATVIKPNLMEARLLAQREQPPTPLAGAAPGVRDEAESLGRFVLSRIETDYVALTLAADGVCLLGRDGTTRHIPAHPVDHPSDVGAGDTFGAAMALALGAGAPPETAARIGIEAAGVAVTKRWTAVVQYQELLQRVSLRDHAAQPYARIPATEDAARDAVSLLMARLAAERKAEHTIVFTNGVFDILHAGHVEFLRQAKALGDLLVVGVNSDRSARKLKGAGRPINSENNRLALVAALDSVDHAVLFDDDTPAGLIRALRPHIHVKGGDYAGATLPEAEAVAEVGGRVAILPLIGSHSTSGVIDRIVALAERHRMEPEARE